MKQIHLPLWRLEDMAASRPQSLAFFSAIGASVHSVDEAQRAQALGATYLTAGHIFTTDCKKVSLQGGCSFFKRYANPYPFRSMRLAGSHLIHRRSKPSFPVVQAGFVLCLNDAVVIQTKGPCSKYCIKGTGHCPIPAAIDSHTFLPVITAASNRSLPPTFEQGL